MNNQQTKLNELIQQINQQQEEAQMRVSNDFLGRFKFDAEIIYKSHYKLKELAFIQQSLHSKKDYKSRVSSIEKRLLIARFVGTEVNHTANITKAWELECEQWLHKTLTEIISEWN